MATKKEVRLINKIMSLSLAINATKKATVFFSFAGHVNWVDLGVRGPGANFNSELEGWGYSNQVNLSESNYQTEDNAIAELQSFVDRLQGYLSGKTPIVLARDSICKKLKATDSDGIPV